MSRILGGPGETRYPGRRRGVFVLNPASAPGIGIRIALTGTDCETFIWVLDILVCADQSSGSLVGSEVTCSRRGDRVAKPQAVTDT